MNVWVCRWMTQRAGLVGAAGAISSFAVSSRAPGRIRTLSTWLCKVLSAFIFIFGDNQKHFQTLPVEASRKDEEGRRLNLWLLSFVFSVFRSLRIFPHNESFDNCLSWSLLKRSMDPQGPVQLSFWPSDNVRQEKFPFCKSKSGRVISEFILVASSQVWHFLHGRHFWATGPLPHHWALGLFCMWAWGELCSSGRILMLLWDLPHLTPEMKCAHYADSFALQNEAYTAGIQLIAERQGIIKWTNSDQKKKKKKWLNYQWCLQ